MAHGITAARYVLPIPEGETEQPQDAQVAATLESGRTEYRRANDDIRDGGMTAYLAEGGTIAPYAPPAPTPADLDAERDRRIAEGCTIQLTDGPAIPIDGSDRTQRFLAALSGTATRAIDAGRLDPFVFRGRDNVIYQLTPPQIIELGDKGLWWVQSLYGAAWAMKDNPDGLPSDFAADARWPDAAV